MQGLWINKETSIMSPTWIIQFTGAMLDYIQARISLCLHWFLTARNLISCLHEQPEMWLRRCWCSLTTWQQVPMPRCLPDCSAHLYEFTQDQYIYPASTEETSHLQSLLLPPSFPFCSIRFIGWVSLKPDSLFYAILRQDSHTDISVQNWIFPHNCFRNPGLWLQWMQIKILACRVISVIDTIFLPLC